MPGWAVSLLRPLPSPGFSGLQHRFQAHAVNVIALAVGITSGMGLGCNTQAMLITRGLAETTRQTTEGVKSAEAILALAGAHDVEMPIPEIVCDLLHEKVTLDHAVSALMQRPPKPEH